ncbi:hypothetical protein DL95DRAFT_393944 [Leptodontidium sp. 2 PMI_412]|nr:hypothetical protein DL95DRAFT_393944 [Leptodontidium sp. 2 PMI_412]
MASLKIAEESTKIAHETRKDSMAMKTIVTLTMLYLLASFVCSVLVRFSLPWIRMERRGALWFRSCGG